MSERGKLLESIACTIKDYRAGEIDAPTPEHVQKWIRQFREDAQVPLLREIDFVLSRTYFSKEFVSKFFAKQIKLQKLAGETPCAFWKGTNFLKIQGRGNSQIEILSLFAEALKSQCDLAIKNCGSKGGSFLYLDDALFSGSRIGNDLKTWIQDTAPTAAVVHILVIASHQLGVYQCVKSLNEVSRNAKKDIKVECWSAVNFENRMQHRDTSEVLWPSTIPDDEELAKYLAAETKFPFKPRNPGGKLEHNVFTSEDGRQLLEHEMLIAGVKIRAHCKNPKAVMRPLGFSYFGLGFGTMIVTFRNCPNNCPLALWWGDSKTTSGALNWYPLFPRKTYAQSTGFGML